MFIDKLKELKENHVLASFFSNQEDTERFSVGYVIEFNDDFVIIALISPTGIYEGFVLREIKSIYKINVDGRYERKILKLSKYYNIEHEHITITNNNLLYNFLFFAHKNNYIVSLELFDSGNYDNAGYIEVLTEEICVMKMISDYGEFDGETTIKLSDISEICCNSEDEIVLKILSSI